MDNSIIINNSSNSSASALFNQNNATDNPILKGFPFKIYETMTKVYDLEDGSAVMAAWGKDTGTMERRLMISVLYSDGRVSPIREYAKSKLVDERAIKDLADMDGVSSTALKEIYKSICNKSHVVKVQSCNNGKCSIAEVYEALCEYVNNYQEKGKVFVKDGYGNILAKYLPEVLKKLDLGYSRLEIEKNFKAYGLLRNSEQSGHPYSYAFNIGGRQEWFVSFQLPEKEVE